VKDVDFRADLWAIAVVAYNALTGRTPFQGANADAFAKALENGAFELPSTLVPSLPATVDAWFVKALQRDPAGRFGGAKELADEFARSAGIDPHERLTRGSMAPPSSVQRGGKEALYSRLSATGSTSGVPSSDGITVIGANQKERASSALLIAIVALVGIGTVIAGLALMHR
jgi:serine/threonine protein kinase